MTAKGFNKIIDMDKTIDPNGNHCGPNKLSMIGKAIIIKLALIIPWTKTPLLVGSFSILGANIINKIKRTMNKEIITGKNEEVK